MAVRLGLEAVAKERLRVDDVPGAGGDLARDRLSWRSDRQVVAGQASAVAGGSQVKVRTTPLVTRPAEAWNYLRASWNKLREQLADDAIHISELLDPVPPGGKAAAAAPPTAPTSAAPAARTPLPMQPKAARRAA